MLAPLVVIVLPVVVALNVNGILPNTVAATSVIDPLIAIVGDVPTANVTVPADTVISRQVRAPVQVTV
jgi:hypothetical protein